MNIYVGNIKSGTAVSAIEDLFKPFGLVTKVVIPKDSKTGNIRGCAFVEMPDEQQAQQAITKLDGVQFSGAWLSVRQAR